MQQRRPYRRSFQLNKDRTAEAPTFALDPELNTCMGAERRGDALPLALRRFQERWTAANPTSAVQIATAKVLAAYSERFPTASPVIRVARLCDIVGAKLTGIRPASRGVPVYSIAESPTRHRGHSGLVQFSPLGRPTIQIPEAIDGYKARVAVAHEIGHILIHQRGDGYDDVTVRLAASDYEEAIAEYAGRLLLLPQRRIGNQNLAETAVRWARDAEVTVHAAACRLGDPDQLPDDLRGVILWKLNRRIPDRSAVAERLTPAWHLCPGAFVPIGKCKARADSLVAEMADAAGATSGVRTERVQIGSLQGVFRVDAFAWGSVSAGTRLVLAVFRLSNDSEGSGITDSERDQTNGQLSLKARVPECAGFGLAWWSHLEAGR